MTTGRGQEDRASETQSPRVIQRKLQGQMSRVLSYGTVDQIDYDQKKVRVRIGGNVTDWIGWGVGRGGRDGEESEWNPPFEGEQVVVGAPNGDYNQGIIITSLDTPDNERPFPGDKATLGVTKKRDGGVETYDSETHTRTLTMPEDGSFKVVVGGAVMEMTKDKIEFSLGGKKITITEEAINTDGKTTLNNGSRKVAFEGAADTRGDTLTEGADDVLV